jgi:hypothetical protein
VSGRKLKVLAGVVTAKWRDPQQCEACGEPFVCGATLLGCWCTEVKLSVDTRAGLRARYDRCLCRACLEKASAGGE